MELDRREMITLVGSVSSSLSLPVSLFSYLNKRSSETTNSAVSDDSILRTSYTPRENGKIQEIKNGNLESEATIGDKETWTMYARSLAQNVGVDIPLFSFFNLYKITLNPPYWDIGYTTDGYVLDLLYSKNSETFKAVLFETETVESKTITADNVDELVRKTRTLIRDELVTQ